MLNVLSIHKFSQMGARMAKEIPNFSLCNVRMFQNVFQNTLLHYQIYDARLYVISGKPKQTLILLNGAFQTR